VEALDRVFRFLPDFTKRGSRNMVGAELDDKEKAFFDAWYFVCSLFVGVLLVCLFGSAIEGDSKIVLRGKTAKLLSAFGILIIIEASRSLYRLYLLIVLVPISVLSFFGIERSATKLIP
jgi:hypothetical protein